MSLDAFRDLDKQTTEEFDSNKPIPALENANIDLPEDELTIFHAVRYNDVNMIERQLRSGISVNVKHEGVRCRIQDELLYRPILTKLYSPLHVAVLHSDLRTIQLLLDNGADVNATEGNNQTPLHFAVACRRADVVEILINAGADVNMQTASRKTVLMEAVMGGHLPILKRLIKAGADMELTDIKGGTALYLATMFQGKDMRFLKCLIEGGCAVNKTNKMGASPLMMAAQTRQQGTVCILLKAGANINQPDNAGFTALHACVEDNRNMHMGLLLIQEGADVNFRDRKGKSPLDKAVLNGRLRMIKLLLTADAHFTHEQLRSERVEQVSKQWPPFQHWLEQELHTPWSLQRCSRRVIRDTLAPNGGLGPSSVDTLCLPTSLKCYLRIKTPEMDTEYGLRGCPSPRPYLPNFALPLPGLTPVVPQDIPEGRQRGVSEIPQL